MGRVLRNRFFSPLNSRQTEIEAGTVLFGRERERGREDDPAVYQLRGWGSDVANNIEPLPRAWLAQPHQAGFYTYKRGISTVTK